jgi:hypothetical protein
MEIEVSIGEIVDKLSILEIKKNKITSVDKLKNILNEYNYLYEIVFKKMKILPEDYKSLLNINMELWDIEDLIRIKEFKKEFDDEFVKLARNVYITNDNRAKIKKMINIKYNSNLIEEKSYEKY